MTQSIQILPYDEGATDAHNDPVPDFGDPVPVNGYIERKNIRTDAELTDDRETPISRWLLVLPNTAELGYKDRVAYDGHTFEVEGTVDKIWNPRTESVHHIEATLKLVEG